MQLWRKDRNATLVSNRTVSAQDEELLDAYSSAVVGVVEAVSPSVVHVFARAAPTGSLFSDQRQGVVQSGSGIIWDPAGHVITNNHVINGTGQIGVRLASGEFVAARVVGTAPNYDLAVLQLERPTCALHPIAVGRQMPHDLAPLPPALREAVDEHDRGAVGRPGLGDVDRHTLAEIDEPVPHAFERGQ